FCRRKSRRLPRKGKRHERGGIGMQIIAWTLAVARAAGAFACLIAISLALRADDTENKSPQIGHPTRLEVFPPAVKLAGPRSRMQLVVTGHYADGSVRDLTRDSHLVSTAADVMTIDSS